MFLHGDRFKRDAWREKKEAGRAGKERKNELE
jgi:hypothetical protein